MIKNAKKSSFIIEKNKKNTEIAQLWQSMYGFRGHVSIANMYISVFLNLGVHIHTKDELSDSNIVIAMDEILDNFIF